MPNQHFPWYILVVLYLKSVPFVVWLSVIYFDDFKQFKTYFSYFFFLLVTILPEARPMVGDATNLCRGCKKEGASGRLWIQCSRCLVWLHRTCAKLPLREFNRLSKNPDFEWSCENCQHWWRGPGGECSAGGGCLSSKYLIV